MVKNNEKDEEDIDRWTVFNGRIWRREEKEREEHRWDRNGEERDLLVEKRKKYKKKKVEENIDKDGQFLS